MNNQDQVPTIAELWDKLKAAIDMVEMDDPKAPDTTMGGKWGTPPGEYGKMAAKMIPDLRQHLVELCRKPLEVYDGSVKVGFHIDGVNLHVHPFAICTPSDLGEIEAMIGFARWELEQRGKEKKG